MAASLSPAPQTKSSLGSSLVLKMKAKTRLRYVFTIDNLRLNCGAALLQAASHEVMPTVSLVWKSGKKSAFGGSVRALNAEGDGTNGARWEEPISLACSIYTTARNGQTKFESRPSEFQLRIEGASATRRKLLGALDLSHHVSYQKCESKLSVPLKDGSGTLSFNLTSVWLKKSALGDESDDSASQASGSEASTASTSMPCHAYAAASGSVSAAAACVDISASRASLGEMPPTFHQLPGVPRHRRGESAGAALSSRFAASLTKGEGTGVRSACDNSWESGGRCDLPPVCKVTRSSSFGMKLRSKAGPGSPGSVPLDATSNENVHAIDNLSGGAMDSFREGGSISPCGNGGGIPGGALAGACGNGLIGRGVAGADGEGLEPNNRAPTPESDAAAENDEVQQDRDSLFSAPLRKMEEVLSMDLPITLDMFQESLLGVDCDSTRFGRLMCARLGYMQLTASSWEGNETDGLLRQVNMTVRCPPKPMLPDVTRVQIRHRLVRQSQDAMLLEREVATLDVPYGETFRVQERWLARRTTDDAGEGVSLRVLTHVHFRGRVGIMAKKITHHSMKKSRKVAALAVELLTQAQVEQQQTPPADSASVASTPALQEQYDALLEEAAYLKRHAHELERENTRLQAMSRHNKKSKQQLLQYVSTLETLLAKERHERAAMEEALTEAYNATIRDLLEEASKQTENLAIASRSNKQPIRKR